MFYIGDNASKSNADVHDSNLLDQKNCRRMGYGKKSSLGNKIKYI